jgi:hypothetical protein
VFAYSSYYGRAIRWAVFLQPLRPHPRTWNLVTATTIGFTAIVLLGRPGEFVRPYLIAVKEKVPVTSQLAIWVLERIFDLLAALLIFGYGLSRVRSSSAQVGEALRWVFQVGGVAVWTMSCICLIRRCFEDGSPTRSSSSRVCTSTGWKNGSILSCKVLNL